MYRSILLPLTVATLTLLPRPATAQQRLVAPDGSFAITVPESFGPVQLNAEAWIQYADTVQEVFVLMFSEGKEDLFGWNITRHSSITVAQILTATDFPEVSDRILLELGGREAVQYEVDGAVQGNQIAYLHTTVDMPAAFVQIVMWSKRSQRELRFPLFREILSTFEALAPADGAAALGVDPFELVPGTWAWESDENGCAESWQTFSIAEDRQSMIITHPEPFEGSDGEMSDETRYVIEGSAGLVLNTYIPGDRRLADDGSPVKWDLVVVGRDRLAWHRTDWPEGALTNPLRRCPQEG